MTVSVSLFTYFLLTLIQFHLLLLTFFSHFLGEIVVTRLHGNKELTSLIYFLDVFNTLNSSFLREENIPCNEAHDKKVTRVLSSEDLLP